MGASSSDAAVGSSSSPSSVRLRFGPPSAEERAAETGADEDEAGGVIGLGWGRMAPARVDSGVFGDAREEGERGRAAGAGAAAVASSPERLSARLTRSLFRTRRRRLLE